MSYNRQENAIILPLLVYLMTRESKEVERASVVQPPSVQALLGSSPIITTTQGVTFYSILREF